MLKSDFDFYLPEQLIAQSPAKPRDSSRLMVLSRNNDAINHRIFNQLPGLLRPGDLLVMNNSKVLPARLLGNRQGHTGACELLLLRQVEGDVWEALARPGKRIRPGTVLQFGDGSLTASVLETRQDGGKLVRLGYNTATLYEKLDAFGRMPLPHYIKKELENNSDYQTVYARHPGSAAAPTAGLHFTGQLLQKLQENGIKTTEVCLHVGLGTFRPVQADSIEDHTMHSEWYTVGEEAARLINETRQNGGRVIAVGTTSCRTLESVGQRYGRVVPASGETDIFLYPGRSFTVIDGLLTNFHLPESTLIMLVAAFYGYKKTMRAYQTAVEEQYRFFSFGDAMLIL